MIEKGLGYTQKTYNNKLRDHLRMVLLTLCLAYFSFIGSHIKRPTNQNDIRRVKGVPKEIIKKVSSSCSVENDIIIITYFYLSNY